MSHELTRLLLFYLATLISGTLAAVLAPPLTPVLTTFAPRRPCDREPQVLARATTLSFTTYQVCVPEDSLHSLRLQLNAGRDISKVETFVLPPLNKPTLFNFPSNVLKRLRFVLILSHILDCPLPEIVLLLDNVTVDA